MENKKTLITLIVVAASLVAFLGGYLISQSGFSGVPAFKTGNILQKFEGNNSVNSNPLESGSLYNPDEISNHQAVSPVISKESNSVIYYEKNTGRVFDVNLKTGSENMVSPNPLPNFLNTVWSPDRKQVVSEFYSPRGNQFKYYNYNTKKSSALPSGIESVAFSPDGHQIVYFQKNDEHSGIFISQPDGSAYKEVLETRLGSVDLFWPQDDMISVKAMNQSDRTWNLMILSKAGAMKKMIDSATDLDVKWSENGQKVFLSFADETGNNGIILKDVKTNTDTPLPVITDASKCVLTVDGNNAYCSVAKIPDGANEKFYKIDIKNNTSQIIETKDMGIDIQELLLSDLEDYLIFLNGVDSNLYSIKL